MRIPSEIESSEPDEITQISFAMLCIFFFVCFLSAHFTRSATPHTGCLCCMVKINCIARLARAESFTWKFSSVRWSSFVGGAVNSPLRSRLITLCCFLYIFRRIDCFFFTFFLSSAQFSSPRVFHVIKCLLCARWSPHGPRLQQHTQHLSRAETAARESKLNLEKISFLTPSSDPGHVHILFVCFFCFNLHLVHLCSRLIFHFFSPGANKKALRLPLLLWPLWESFCMPRTYLITIGNNFTVLFSRHI